MKKIATKILGLAGLLVLALGLLTACGKKNTITIEVTGSDGVAQDYTVKTDAEYLKDAMDECKDLTYDGYDTDYGYYITAVNGETADFETDGAYWSIYVNGDYGQYSCDQQPVADGDTINLTYEVYVAE